MNAPTALSLDELIDDDADTDAAIVGIMEAVRETPDEYQHEALVEWCRSAWWHSAMMIYIGEPGKLARSAWRALSSDLAADTPGKRWNDIPFETGRASIKRLLGLSDSPFATYASIPFKSWIDDDERAWIAAAVGCRPWFNFERTKQWYHIDIRDVILWDPRTGESRLVGEHPSTTTFVLPDIQDDAITVWADAGAFFKAWALRRTKVAEKAQMRARGTWKHPVTEARDGDLPGGLVIGPVHKMRWSGVSARKVTAGEGVTKADLRAAALRAAHLPQFTEGGDARG